MIFYARIAADVRYERVRVNAIGSTVHLTELEVKPRLSGLKGDVCVIRVDKASLRGVPLDRVDGRE